MQSKSLRDILRSFGFCVCLCLFVISGFAVDALAVPETAGVRITDVTTSSFSVVWMTDVAAEPMVEVYSDSAMTEEITDRVVITPMPAVPEVAEAAKSKGIMKVRVSGLRSSTKYYVRTVTRDPASPESVAYSALYEVVTASEVRPYHYINGAAQVFSNDLVSFRVYLRPSDTDYGIGDLIILESTGSLYPVSAFVGDGIDTPEGLLDLNNLFDDNGLSLDLGGGERLIITVYRGRALSNLMHYRKMPQDEGMIYVVEPLNGFFADINLDGRVDDQDFEEFRRHYRSMPDDLDYNPDFNFVEDPEDKVDAREFSRFSIEYGRTDVE